jgi:hypothetical protein
MHFDNLSLILTAPNRIGKQSQNSHKQLEVLKPQIATTRTLACEAVSRLLNQTTLNTSSG